MSDIGRCPHGKADSERCEACSKFIRDHFSLDPRKAAIEIDMPSPAPTPAETPRTDQCSICLADPPYGGCAGDESCAYILKLQSDFTAKSRELEAKQRECERLTVALERLGSMEAFEGARAINIYDAELVARIKYACAALADAERK